MSNQWWDQTGKQLEGQPLKDCLGKERKGNGRDLNSDLLSPMMKTEHAADGRMEVGSVCATGLGWSISFQDTHYLTPSLHHPFPPKRAAAANTIINAFVDPAAVGPSSICISALASLVNQYSAMHPIPGSKGKKKGASTQCGRQ